VREHSDDFDHRSHEKKVTNSISQQPVLRLAGRLLSSNTGIPTFNTTTNQTEDKSLKSIIAK
jgi:hypothetical protein